jgi:DNA-binding response OmpR family regulator
MTLGRRMVLLVEDSPGLRSALRLALQSLDLEVLEAADGRAALERLAACTPDLVVLDLVLPRVSGFEVCEALRRSPQQRRVPVLVTSGRVLPEDRAQALEAGADAFLAKPFGLAEFRARVKELLGTVHSLSLAGAPSSGEGAGTDTPRHAQVG